MDEKTLQTLEYPKILDRLAANSIRIDIDGPSYRQHLARQRAGAQGPEQAQETVP